MSHKYIHYCSAFRAQHKHARVSSSIKMNLYLELNTVPGCSQYCGRKISLCSRFECCITKIALGNLGSLQNFCMGSRYVWALNKDIDNFSIKSLLHALCQTWLLWTDMCARITSILNIYPLFISPRHRYPSKHKSIGKGKGQMISIQYIPGLGKTKTWSTRQKVQTQGNPHKRLPAFTYTTQRLSIFYSFQGSIIFGVPFVASIIRLYYTCASVVWHYYCTHVELNTVALTWKCAITKM